MTDKEAQAVRPTTDQLRGMIGPQLDCPIPGTDFEDGKPRIHLWASDAVAVLEYLQSHDALASENASKDARIAGLEAELDLFVNKAAENMRLYLDLLMQVVHVVPGESRHESARRIIQQHESRPSEGPCAAPALSTSAAKGE